MKKVLLYACLYLFLSVQSVSIATVTPQNPYLKYIAGVIYAEAINESFYCKSLVATTMWDRANGDTNRLYRVCILDKQYAEPKYGDGEKCKECLRLAESLYNNTFIPKTVRLGNGEEVYPDHFFSGKSPWWAQGKVWKKVDGLKFLKLGSHREVE
jgi:hypothetical protein